MSQNDSSILPHPPSTDIFSEDSIALTITYICLGILILIGNCIVCFIYIKSQSLRTLTNRFVISSSIAGILVGLLFVPFYLVLDTMTQAVSTLAMPISGFIASLTGFAMLFNVAALTYDRHIAIFRPLRYNELMTSRKTNLILAGVWTVPFLLSATPMLLANTIKSPERIALCFKIYQGFLSTLLCVVISIVFAIYLRIAILTRKHLKEERKDSYARSVRSVTSQISLTLRNCICGVTDADSRKATFCIDDDVPDVNGGNGEIAVDMTDATFQDSTSNTLQEPIVSVRHLSEKQTDAITAENTRRNSQTIEPNICNLQIYPSRRRKKSAITNDEFVKCCKSQTRKLSLDITNMYKPHLVHEQTIVESKDNFLRSPTSFKSSKVSFQSSTPVYSPRSLHELKEPALPEIENESDDEERSRMPLLKRQHRIKSDEFENIYRSIKYSPDVQRFSARANQNLCLKSSTNQLETFPSRSRILYTLNSDEDTTLNICEKQNPPCNRSIAKSPSPRPSNRRVSIQENLPISKPKCGSLENVTKPKLKPKIKAKSLSLTKKSIDKPKTRRHTLTVINYFGSHRNIGVFSRIRKQFSSTSTKELSTTDSTTSFSLISDWLKKRSSSTNVFAQARVFLHEIRVAKVLAIIFIINSLCWMPLIFINFADAFGRSSYISEELLMASQLLFMINALLMPYVYAFCKKDFKQALKKQFRLIFKETIYFR